MTTRTLSVVLPDADYAKIRESAMKHHLPLSSYVRSIVMRHINGDLDVPAPQPITAKPASQPKPTPPTPEPAPTPVVEPKPKVDLTSEERAAIATAWGFSDE